MKRFLALALSVCLIVAMVGCSPKTTQPGTSATPAASTPKTGESTPAPTSKPVEYRTVYSSEVTTLNYLKTASTNEFAIAANVIDTLIEYDKYGVAQPSLAETWESSADGLVWTFKLRSDAKWVDHNGAEVASVTAQDFVDAAEYLLTSENESSTASIFYGVIENAEAYYNKEITDFSKVGVKALDEYTLQYTLSAPTPYFLSMLTYVCFMPVSGDFLKEKGDAFGTDNTTLLYNGAYVLSTFDPQTSTVYTKNEAYWDRDQVYITTITQTYNKEARTLSPELFKRGEVDFAFISSDILDDWLANADTKDLVSPSRNGYYSYFYAFNFDPQFDAAYEPDNWKLAVNNENFRKSIFFGLDRAKAKMTSEPNNPEKLLLNTITPPNFVDLAGKDYTLIGGLSDITARDSFNSASALEYKNKAMEELTAAGATFPVKILMSYNPSTTDWDKECQVVEQQLEGLLGTDYIDIIVEAGPASGFLSEVRRSGKYALLKCNWGPDYADPETYTDPFSLDGTYNWPHKIEGHENPDGTKIYNALVDAAKAEKLDIAKRLEAFAKAETYLIDNAFVIPFSVSNEGYKVSRLNPLEAQYSPFGVSELRYKGQKLLDKPMNMDEFYAALARWETERAAALAAAK